MARRVSSGWRERERAHVYACTWAGAGRRSQAQAASTRGCEGAQVGGGWPTAHRLVLREQPLADERIVEHVVHRERQPQRVESLPLDLIEVFGERSLPEPVNDGALSLSTEPVDTLQIEPLLAARAARPERAGLGTETDRAHEPRAAPGVLLPRMALPSWRRCCRCATVANS